MSFRIRSVLLLDGIDKVCGETLQKAGINVVTSAKLTAEELVQELQKHDAVVVRSATKITASVLEQCRHLTVVGRAGTGVDNIDVKTATEMGVLVMNTPGGNTLSAAEHTCALICSLSRSIPLACASLKTGAWDRKKLMGNELGGKTLAIIGLGRIGREVSQRMKAFEMTVVGYDPLVSPETAASWGIKYLSLDEIWPIADYITVHTPLIPQTRNLIGTDSLAACKPTVKIVNVARGGIVDEQALLKALNAGTCGGAALDVFETEPPQDLTLVQHPKVICTPHLGANTFEAQKRVAVEIAEQFIDMSQGKPLFGVVNAPSLAMAGSDLARPWVQLASSMGSIASQLLNAEKDLATYSLDIFGGKLESLNSLFGASVLSGALSSKAGANLINATTIAKDRGITYSQTLSAASQESLTLRAKLGSKEVCVKGSILGSTPVLISINGHDFDKNLILHPSMAFCLWNSDSMTFASFTGALSGEVTFIFSSKQTDSSLFVVRTIQSLSASSFSPPADSFAKI